jgi:hypothetical protein
MTDISINRGSTAEFRIGAVLRQAWSVFARAPGSLFLLSAIPFLPSIYGALTGFQVAPEQFLWVILPRIAWQILLSFLIQMIITYAAFQELRGQRFSLGGSVAKAVPRLVPALGASIAATILVFLGMILLVIPGLIVAAALYVAIPVCVVERAGPIDSLRRSRELTQGFRGKIFGLLLIVGIAAFAAGYLVRLILLSITGPLVTILAGIAVQMVATAFGAVLVAIIYYRLRVIKDGIDLDKIASVFD